MYAFTDEIISKLLKESLDTATVDKPGWHDTGTSVGSEEGEFIRWLTMSDPEEGLLEDVKRIRNHPLVPDYIPIHGCIYEVETGNLIEVESAMEAGRSREKASR